MRPLVGITLLYKRHIVTVKTALSTDWLSCFPQFSGSAGPSSSSWVWRRSSSVDLLSSVPAHWPTTSSIKWAGLYSCLAVRLNIELEASSQTDPQKLSSEGDYHENILKYVVRFLPPNRRNCIIYSICNDSFGHSPLIQCPCVSEIGELFLSDPLFTRDHHSRYTFAIFSTPHALSDTVWREYGSLARIEPVTFLFPSESTNHYTVKPVFWLWFLWLARSATANVAIKLFKVASTAHIHLRISVLLL